MSLSVLDNRIPNTKFAFDVAQSVKHPNMFSVMLSDNKYYEFQGHYDNLWRYEVSSQMLYIQARDGGHLVVWAIALSPLVEEYAACLNAMMRTIIDTEFQIEFCVDDEEFLFYYQGYWVPVKGYHEEQSCFELYGFGFEDIIKIPKEKQVMEDSTLRQSATVLRSKDIIKEEKKPRVRRSASSSLISMDGPEKTSLFSKAETAADVPIIKSAVLPPVRSDLRHYEIPGAWLDSEYSDGKWVSQIRFANQEKLTVPGCGNGLYTVAGYIWASVNNINDHKLYMLGKESLARSNESKAWNDFMSHDFNGALKLFATRHYVEFIIPELNLKVRASRVECQENCIQAYITSRHDYMPEKPGTTVPILISKYFTGCTTFKLISDATVLEVSESGTCLFRYDLSEMKVLYRQGLTY